MSKTNNERLQEIAEGMQDLNERLVYVGGAMAEVYATDPAATEPRTTLDVDCVVDSTSYSEHAAFEELLRQRHFQNDQTPDAPICRWVYKGEKVEKSISLYPLCGRRLILIMLLLRSAMSVTFTVLCTAITG